MGQGVRMDKLAEFESCCPSRRREWDTSSCMDDLLEEDEKDRAKRASRNKSEKKRRDQFNVLIKELCTMLQGQDYPRKMDKSTVLQRTIDFLQKQKEITAQTESCDIRQDWKPLFLCNEEFTQLMLEALDGFLIALTTDGNIIYVSDSVSSLIGHLPSDMVDQNILNFLPEREHGEVYKLLSSHMLMADPVTPDFMDNESHIEFCCHLARGNIDPKEPPTYEYVKFVGDFKFHNYVPTMSCNGFDLVMPRPLQASLDEQVCLVATVRLAMPQFLKDLCTVEDPCDEFTSRHSLEWKFLFLDHRASPIIGYLPFEVLGTSGYDYYHVDDLELIAECHKQLMQFGKGKSCYYRFLTKGQQWIWLQTHYYITYHQWNSKPEFIVCTHTVISYAEVRAERRRELGLEETLSEVPSSSLIKSHDVYLDVSQEAPRVSRTRSVSSHSSRKSSHTAMSDSVSNSSMRFTETSTPTRQSMSTVPEKSSSRIQPNSSKTLVQSQNSSNVFPQPSVPHSATGNQPPVMTMYQLQPPQLGVMNELKEQLEERTRILQADIQTQQQELHEIKEQLQRVSSSNLEVQHQQLMCVAQGQAPRLPPHTHGSVTVPLYSSPLGFPPAATRPVQLPLSLASDASQRLPDADFSQNGQLRMLLNQPIQPLMPDSAGTSQASQYSAAMQQTKYTMEQHIMASSLPVQQMNCSAVIVPSPVFTSPIVLPHNSFMSPLAQPVYPQQPPPSQPSLQQHQHHFFQQMQAPGLLSCAQTPALFHTAHVAQTGTMGYVQEQQHCHSQPQSGNLSDMRNM